MLEGADGDCNTQEQVPVLLLEFITNSYGIRNIIPVLTRSARPRDTNVVCWGCGGGEDFESV